MNAHIVEVRKAYVTGYCGFVYDWDGKEKEYQPMAELDITYHERKAMFCINCNKKLGFVGKVQ